jgi:formylglycine-generating enzyme required for sulfatase activity
MKRQVFLLTTSVCAFCLLPFRPEAEAQTASVQSVPSGMQRYTETIPGTDVKFDMLPIPGGAFTMGSPPKEPHRSDDEGPQHEVKLEPFWMGKMEVTWDEFDLFAFSQDISKKKQKRVDLASQSESEKAADAITRPTPPYADETFGYCREHCPVISITHHAAMEYCTWLSTKTGKIYRLPTEAEWEYACRAGSQTAYSFADDPVKLNEYGWYAENSKASPHTVGQKKPNAWGLYDMHGNAAEWCLDGYDKTFYGAIREKIALSPVRIPGEEEYPHVVRGGSWDDDASRLRSAARRGSHKDWNKRDPQIPQSFWWLTDATFVGFRVVRPLKEQENLVGFRSKVKVEKNH